MSERVALIIGNGNYQTEDKLQNPVHDAKDIEEQLRRFSFITQLVTDATNKEMDRALKSFQKLLPAAEVALVFFAGHGLQIADEPTEGRTENDDNLNCRRSDSLSSVEATGQPPEAETDEAPQPRRKGSRRKLQKS